MKFELGDKVVLHKYYKKNNPVPKDYIDKYDNDYLSNDNLGKGYVDSYVISKIDDGPVLFEKYKPELTNNDIGYVVGLRNIKLSMYLSIDDNPYTENDDNPKVVQSDETYEQVYLVAVNMNTIRYVKKNLSWIAPLTSTRMN